MRIALFTETFLPHTDGVVTRLVHTIEELVRAGDEVLVAAPYASGLPASYAGAQIVGMPSMTLPFYRDFRLGVPIAYSAGSEALLAYRPDIVHAVNPICLGVGAVWYARRQRAQLVASYHTNVPAYSRRYKLGMFERPLWRYLRVLHDQASINLCTSRPVRAMLLGRGFQRLHLWEPGVDSELFTPTRRSDAWRDRLTDGHPERTLLLYVGRLAAEKGLEQLAPALPHLPGCHLALIGDGPAAPQLRQTFTGLPVTFTGSLFGEELADAYAAADVFVLPSTTETLGLVVIEAMASGVPVVGARCGGIPDLIEHGETGLLYDPDTPGDLLGQLRPLISDDALRARLARAARTRAEGWSWAATTAGLRAHYGSLLPTPAMLPDRSVHTSS